MSGAGTSDFHRSPTEPKTSIVGNGAKNTLRKSTAPKPSHLKPVKESTRKTTLVRAHSPNLETRGSTQRSGTSLSSTESRVLTNSSIAKVGSAAAIEVGAWVYPNSRSAYANYGRGRVLFRETQSDVPKVLIEFDGGDFKWIPEKVLRTFDWPAPKPTQYYEPGSNPLAELTLHIVAELIKHPPLLSLVGEYDIHAVPHQVNLVAEIIGSGNINCIIGDDVGLGKLIEAGLLVSELIRSGAVRRALFVCPAALMNQVQDEMRERFGTNYRIYGKDFEADVEWKWNGLDFVIVSADRVKPNYNSLNNNGSIHYDRIHQSGEWDVIVVDEAHHLDGGALGRTGRYELLVGLRELTPRLVLMSATRHRGDAKAMRRLSTVVRPSLSARLTDAEEDQKAIAEAVFRNHKSQVVDRSGRPLFQGMTAHTAHIAQTPQYRLIMKGVDALMEFARQAAREGHKVETHKIGFVYSNLRKLASSSLSALTEFLRRRRAVVEKEYVNHINVEGRGESLSQSLNRRKTFLEGELAELADLIDRCAGAEPGDAKIVAVRQFYNEFVIGRGMKALFFTEFRSTQKAVVEAIESISGCRVCQLNGDMTTAERRSSVDDFNNGTQVLVSTDAGSEGLNLQKRCSILVNIDIPWSPTKMIQRIGRVYRYGQDCHVHVFNMIVDSSIDDRVLAAGKDRIDIIVHDLSLVSDEYDNTFASSVFGNVGDKLDSSAAIGSVISGDNEPYPVYYDDDLIAEANALQLEVQPDGVFNGPAVAASDRLKTATVMRFIMQASRYTGVEARIVDADREIFSLRLPQNLVGVCSDLGRNTEVTASTLRRSYNESGGTVTMLKASGAFVQYLVAATLDRELLGQRVSASLPGASGVLAAFSISINVTEVVKEVRLFHRMPSGEIFEGEYLLEALMAVESDLASHEAVLSPEACESALSEIRAHIEENVLDRRQGSCQVELLGLIDLG